MSISCALSYCVLCRAVSSHRLIACLCWYQQALSGSCTAQSPQWPGYRKGRDHYPQILSRLSPVLLPVTLFFRATAPPVTHLHYPNNSLPFDAPYSIVPQMPHGYIHHTGEFAVGKLCWIVQDFLATRHVSIVQRDPYHRRMSSAVGQRRKPSVTVFLVGRHI